MQVEIGKSAEVKVPVTTLVNAVRVGEIVRIGAEGQALVDFPGNPIGPVEARSVISIPRPLDQEVREGIQVLLLFENENVRMPIIVGIVRDQICPPASSQERAILPERVEDAVIDGRKMVFDAREEILLRCGKSSVTLRKDGKIVVSGTHIVSRASVTNRLKGGTVAIN